MLGVSLSSVRAWEEGACPLFCVRTTGSASSPTPSRRGSSGRARRARTPPASALDGLVIPGGWAPDKLRRNQHVLQLVREMDAQEKIIATICHGGWVPISAGIMRGRRAVGSTGIKDDITNAGGIWTNAAAFRDGHMVWGRVVEDIPDFCRELVDALAE